MHTVHMTLVHMYTSAAYLIAEMIVQHILVHVNMFSEDGEMSE